MPDVTNPEFPGKTIVDKSGGYTRPLLRHATSVGQCISTDLPLQLPRASRPFPATTRVPGWAATSCGRQSPGADTQPLYSTSRVANHSWIGSTTDVANGTTYDSSILRRLDWVIARDEFITVVGVNNGGTNVPLLSSSFNAIAVGRSDGIHAAGTVNVGLAPYDTIYTAGRVKPDIVAPSNTHERRNGNGLGRCGPAGPGRARPIPPCRRTRFPSPRPTGRATTIRNAERVEVDQGGAHGRGAPLHER